MDLKKAKEKILDMSYYLDEVLKKGDKRGFKNPNVFANLQLAKKESDSFRTIDYKFFMIINDRINTIFSQLKSKDYPKKNINKIKRNIESLYDFLILKFDKAEKQGELAFQ